jgi:hypothetical protein
MTFGNASYYWLKAAYTFNMVLMSAVILNSLHDAITMNVFRIG